jgi:hypothetical protein
LNLGLFILSGFTAEKFLQHATYALANFGAFQRHLTDTYVVNSLDACAPSLNLCLVHIASGCGVFEEQSQ